LNRNCADIAQPPKVCSNRSLRGFLLCDHDVEVLLNTRRNYKPLRKFFQDAPLNRLNFCCTKLRKLVKKLIKKIIANLIARIVYELLKFLFEDDDT